MYKFPRSRHTWFGMTFQFKVVWLCELARLVLACLGKFLDIDIVAMEVFEILGSGS